MPIEVAFFRVLENYSGLCIHFIGANHDSVEVRMIEVWKHARILSRNYLKIGITALLNVERR